MSDTTKAANESMLAIAVNAAAGGHDLPGFDPMEGEHAVLRGYQAECRRCGKTAWVGRQGVMYSFLAEIRQNSGAEGRSTQNKNSFCTIYPKPFQHPY